MKRNGFTLIELLVVVAIIGILAAVGVVAYSGYTSAAKANAVKAQQTNVIKYIMSETKKCDLGETTAMDGNLNCSDLNVAVPVPVVLIAAEKALKDKLKNPVNPSAPSICSAPSGTCNVYRYSTKNKDSPGVINLREHGPTTMHVATCVAEPCSSPFPYQGKSVGYIDAGYIAILD